MNNSIAYESVALAIHYMFNDVVAKNFWFSRLSIAGYVDYKFIGWRLNR